MNREVFGLKLNTRDCWDKVKDGIPWDELPNGVFAVSDSPLGMMSKEHEQLFVAENIDELKSRLGALHERRAIQSASSALPIRVLVETAVSKTKLFNPMRERMLQNVLFAVEQFRKLGDIDAMKRIRAATERKGGKPGPNRRDASRWKIDLLLQLAGNPSRLLKEFVNRPRRPDSASAELSRFCLDVYSECIRCGEKTPEARQESQVLSDRFGFDLGKDVSAVEEAYRRGEQSFQKLFPGDAQPASNAASKPSKVLRNKIPAKN